MTTLTCTSTSKSITLLDELADSGEGKVWRTNHQGYLAKIYHQPTTQRMEKLAVMVAHPPKEPNSHLNHISFAWPHSLLKDVQGNLVGFLMPEIRDAKELLAIYNPSLRKRLNITIDWRFLHVAAQNIASIIAALHENGYVLGDIKPQNILVNRRALPSIIDTDSFQVKHPHRGDVYRCLVGTSDYTPPELMGKDLGSIEQTEIHDRFRLGVIIYQLLFNGQNFYSGEWMGEGEPPEPGELIRQGLWLYSPDSWLKDTPNTMTLDIVHPAVKKCFMRCFNEGYKNPQLRPSAREWLKVLEIASGDLVRCGQVETHYYSGSYGKCYWCERASSLGSDIFPEMGRVNRQFPIPNTNQWQLQHSITGHLGEVTSLGFSPDGRTLASSSSDNSIKLWDVATGKEIASLSGHSATVYSLGFSPDGCTLASGSSDNSIKLWDVATGKEIASLSGHSATVYSLGFSSDGVTLASGSWDKTIKLWDVGRRHQIASLSGHSSGVLSVAFSPDGGTLASSSLDNTIKLWHVASRQEIASLAEYSDSVNSVAFSPDGGTLASASVDNTIKIWRLK